MKRSGWLRRGNRNKYGAVKTKVDGVMFDSRLESQWYNYLKILGTAGQIRDLELQKEFVLTVNGKQICIYIADYFFFDIQKNIEVVGDAKGKVTDVFRLKWKLMQALYPQYHYQIYTGKPRC